MTDMQARINLNRTSLDGKMKGAGDLDSERNGFVFFESSLRCQLRLTSADSEGVEDLKCRLDVAVAKECPTQNNIAFSWR